MHEAPVYMFNNKTYIPEVFNTYTERCEKDGEKADLKEKAKSFLLVSYRYSNIEAAKSCNSFLP